MPFERYLKGRVAFEPEVLAIMGDALALAIRALDLSPDQVAKRALIAQLIVQAATDDQLADATALSRTAVAAFRKSTNH